ncbi:unnamed protein product [Caenorhabditis auriculariae]|uniref:Acyl-coenzyme A oxidase n=1 Tax=Caenorhabditis auriculariae TaxID=2777116 RepID=A0A8S1GQU0_9PELO|nr:unnamed protein product [Caenorhabditis auriculariae]
MSAHLNAALREGDNPELTEERRKATFDTRKLADEFFGSHLARRRREIAKAIDAIPELHDTKPLPFMTREEKVEEAARKVFTLSKHITDIVDLSNNRETQSLNEMVIGIEGMPISLHFAMFIPALQGQADDEQKREWLDRAIRMEIIGTYAQTELGHGTNLRMLETTATYDKQNKEFILNSPTLTSLKWWPGNMGKSCNYAIVVANLIIDDKLLGPHSFMVQLRDENSHETMPNIQIGDIGPKMAYNSSDNGFLKLSNLRIPRRNMLMKHAKVQEDGTYKKPPHEKLAYSAMVHVRSHMITQHAMLLAYALSISTRYSCIRRQGYIDPKKDEVKVIEYQTQQHRLFPHIARAYAFAFAGTESIRKFEIMKRSLEAGNIELIADLHALTSGLKAVVTYLAGQGIEQARQACGGHGYSMASYMGEIYGVGIAGCTYEGENLVMMQQLGRYLIKAVKSVKEGKKPTGYVAYLAHAGQRHSLIDCRPNEGYAEHIRAFEHIARRQTFRAAERLQKYENSGLSTEQAWNNCTVELNRASRLHTRLFIACNFYERVLDVEDMAVREVLEDLLHLHLNYELIDIASYALEAKKIRPNAVSLVDSWEITDREHRSVLGRRDGHVYENLFKWAKSSDLNQNDVLPSHKKHLLPMMLNARKQSKL